MTAQRAPYGRPKVAVVVSGWPRVSEVFAQNELLALHRAGLLAGVFATKAGETGPRQPGLGELEVEVLPGADTAARSRALARRLAGSGVTALHGYFAHEPAAVAAGAAQLLGIPYGFSVHALDARKVPRPEMAERAAGAAVVVCCNPDAAADVQAAGHEPQLLQHGVDLGLFPASPLPDGVPLALLAVGRVVEKKGFAVLLQALALVQRDVVLRLVGDGPLRPALVEQVAALGLGDRVELLGRRTHAELPGLYARADAVVVPSVVDSTGDRDGLPNVVLEAMASARPVVASDVAALSTAVTDGVTGLLVRPGDPVALAHALTRLVDEPGLRTRAGAAGRTRVERDFALDRCTAAFCHTLETVYG